MIMDSVADWIVVGEYLLALLALITFTTGYIGSSRGQVFRHPEGRHMVFFRGSLAVFMGMAIAHNLVTEYAGRDAVRVAVVGAFAAAAIHGTVLLYRAQAARRRAEPAPETLLGGLLAQEGGRERVEQLLREALRRQQGQPAE